LVYDHQEIFEEIIFIGSFFLSSPASLWRAPYAPSAGSPTEATALCRRPSPTSLRMLPPQILPFLVAPEPKRFLRVAGGRRLLLDISAARAGSLSMEK
jgi:hypothetical protein